MDIHPPKHPIKSVRDFLLEILTITCGIVIALSLEGAIQYGRAQQLSSQTRNDFLAEISANRETIASRRSAAPEDEAMLRYLIDIDTRRLAHQPAPTPQKTLGRDFTPLPSDAWQTALATQGIGQMRHETARSLSAAYDEQAAFNSLQEHALNEWLAVGSYGDVRTDSDEEIRQALQHLRTCYGLAISLDNVDRDMDRDYAAAQSALRDSAS